MAASIWAFSIGCSSTADEEARKRAIPLERIPPLPSEVILAPGDEIEVRFFDKGDLDTTQVIRPDGKITLPPIDEIRAAGLTPAQLDEQLTERFNSDEATTDQNLSVIIRKLNNQVAYVGGEVEDPGPIDLRSTQISILQAIFENGGPTKDNADLESVVLVRTYPSGETMAYTVNVEEMLYSPGPVPLLTLAPNDVVFVPNTTIDKIDVWVDQHIYQLMPFSRVGAGVIID
ncbi:MAG: polysaccharide biosynthesis/export family protein [Planctomycetota bacterium]